MKTIVTHPNFDYLGESLVNNNPNLKQAKVKFETFKDGWPNIFIENVSEDIEHKDITYIGDYSKPEYLFTNYSIVRALLGYYADKVRVIVPFFPVGTMERISEKGEVATSSYMADILSHIPHGRQTKSSIHIFDLHTLEQRFFFDDFKVNTELHTAMDLIKERITPETIIVFPDEGAKKRFAKEFIGNRVVHCSKQRIGEKREITINSEIDLNGKELIIIDDLIQSGGTIIETAKKLRELGAKKISAYATHGVFVEDSYLKLCQNLDTLYTTDSIPRNIAIAKSIKNMEILPILDMIQRKIIGVI